MDMNDFEMPSVNALLATYPRMTITGCFFPISASIYLPEGSRMWIADRLLRRVIQLVHPLSGSTGIGIPQSKDRVLESFVILLEGH